MELIFQWATTRISLPRPGRPIRKVDIYRLWLIIRFRYTKTNFTAKTNIKQRLIHRKHNDHQQLSKTNQHWVNEWMIWACGLSVTASKKNILRWTKGWSIVFEKRQLGLFFSIVSFRISPQIAWSWGSKIALAAFVWLFSTVGSQMCPQIACLRGCKITLVAFVSLFSTVCFQMRLQIVHPRGSIVTLVALVWLFSGVCSQMNS